jgi:hypothetical protein
MTEEEALVHLIQTHRRTSGLKDFVRILLALELETWFQAQARSNQKRGGQMKASSNLTEADKLDVRSEIAAVAGVSTGNVSKAKQLLLHAHPELLRALHEGEVSIHRAWIWLQKPAQQLAQLELHQNMGGITRKINSLLQAHRHPASDEPLDVECILAAIAALDSERKTSIPVVEIGMPGEFMLISTGLRRALTSQGELMP